MTGPNRKTSFAALALAVLCVTGAGCDLFKPAEPEQPAGETILGNYTTIDSTLDTMALAVRAKAQLDGENAYLRGLADATLDGRVFIAEFDPATVSRYLQTGTDVPNPWRIEHEGTFYRRFAGSDGTDAHDMEWRPGDQSDPTAAPDSAIVFRKYVVTGRSSSNIAYTIAVGQAEMHFIRNSRGWIMVRWIDREDPAPPANAVSYGMLRLTKR